MKNSKKYKAEREKWVIQPKTGYCEADYVNRFIVDPKGNLHKCTVSFSPELRVGYLTKEGTAIFDITKLAIWLAKDPFSRDKCKNCKSLPICMGGCYSALLSKPNNNGCPSPAKPETISNYLELAYEEML